VVAGEHPSLVPGEVVEQAKLGGRRGHGLAVYRQGHGHGIDFDLPDPDRPLLQRPLEAPQHGLHARHQLPRAEGLGNVVVRAQFQAEHAVGFTAARREEDHRDRSQRLRLADLATEFQAIFAGNHDVENEQGGTAALRVREHGLAGGIELHAKSRPVQVVPHQAGNIGIVLHHKNDIGLHCHIVAVLGAGN
jgi:hypothetical protein